MLFVLCLFTLSNAYLIFDGKSFFDSWAIFNTAGLNIELSKNSTTNYLSAKLRCWDSIYVQRTSSIDTSASNFFSYEIYFKSDQVKTMRFRTRLFSSAYNQQTETELKPYDYIVKSGIATKVYVPLSYEDEKNTLQTFSIQRIETTDEPITFKINAMTLEAEGVPTPNNEVYSESDEKSQIEETSTDGSNPIVIIGLLSIIMMIGF
ncbi:hypothetical protein ENUP19_0115G0019 [Entamoeba nuttalli]|uniref:Uncharacterized protein n=1 Tax=Entamoeba nuttalli TaxID=412467 RepID=A0ABQ0DI72_9EUKA